MNAAAPAPAVWTERYETLRQCAREGSPMLTSPPVGWIVLARHGMAAWMRRWTEATEPPPTPSATRSPRPSIPLPAWQTELTVLLAQMTAAHLSTPSRP